MQYLTSLSLCLLTLSASCQNLNNADDRFEDEVFNCSKGLMTSASYQCGVDEAIPSIKDIRSGFLIVVDTDSKAINFISSWEEYARKQANSLDTSSLSWYYSDSWSKLTVNEKFRKLEERKREYKLEADTVHMENNRGQNQIWIVNNTADTVSVQMQDGTFICVLEALNRNGRWAPVQYCRLSTCGNSYYAKRFSPKVANSFIAVLPDKGDFETTLRYKLLGMGKFYYSNEFKGRINYCEFAEDGTSSHRPDIMFKGHYKLETLVDLVSD